MEIKSLKITTLEPSPLVKSLLQDAVQSDVEVHKAPFKETLETLADLTEPTAFFLDMLTEEEIRTFLKSVRDHNIERLAFMFVFLNNDSQASVEQFLEMGASDVITKSTQPEAASERISLVAPILTTHFGTDIDITPEAVPQSNKALRVFVVEDDSLLRNLLDSKLSSSNISCSFATDFNDSLAEMKNFNPSLVILDIMLPDKNGLDILAEMKQDVELKQVPVVIFSNRDEQTDRSRASELGANAYYVKAMTDLSDLVKTIENLV